MTSKLQATQPERAHIKFLTVVAVEGVSSWISAGENRQDKPALIINATTSCKMMRILQALIINTTTLGSHLLRTVVRANSGAGTCAMCTMAHINKVIRRSLIIHTLQ